MSAKTIIFDADGVVALPEDMFSVVYARSHGYDPEPFEQFFRTDWKAIVTGKKDLKESILENPDLWKLQGTVDELLDFWFTTENIRNDELIEFIRQLKTQGYTCYLATEQEKYRGEYMKNVMFPGVFDGYFITGEMGISKSEPAFFEKIVESLQAHSPNLTPQDVIFFDDSQSKVDAAAAIGIDARLYVSIDQVKSLLTS